MRLSRKIVSGVAALAGVALVAASTAEAQTKCQHIGQWTRTPDGFVCFGDYFSGHCVWYDDCRMYAE